MPHEEHEVGHATAKSSQGLSVSIVVNTDELADDRQPGSGRATRLGHARWLDNESGQVAARSIHGVPASMVNPNGRQLGTVC